MAHQVTLQDMANAARFLAVDMVQRAGSGHPGLPMGMADVATVLFAESLRFDPSTPLWPNRDRFVLSAGHGSALLYALLYLTGYAFTVEDLKSFRTLHSPTPGHPEYNPLYGIETTTGPLAQGLANAVGMAMGQRLLAHEYGEQLINHFVYALVGDGCLMEGLSQEAISMAGHLGLSHLIVLFDSNGITIDGPTSLATSDNTSERFHACGWEVLSCDGYDHASVHQALVQARTSSRPSLIICTTRIGYGAPHKEGTSAAHGNPLGLEESASAKKRLKWPYGFDVPETTLSAWRRAGLRHRAERLAWEEMLAHHPHSRSFTRRLEGRRPPGWTTKLKGLKAEALPCSTRAASLKVLEVLAPLLPELVGGSADLTPSNHTYPSGLSVFTAETPGRYIHYGIREHAMGAVMNGLAVYGGFVPYGGTFLVFSDYARPSLRLSALMKQKVLYIMSHDSIGVGEDGPTHQPVEHLASLRSIPGLLVFRPCDLVETVECWELALEHEGPSVLALSRQSLPCVSKRVGDEVASRTGGYLIRDTPMRDLTLIATGSEVSLALEVARDLHKSTGLKCAVVSVPCQELLHHQPSDTQEELLGSAPRVVIEAGVRQSWDVYLRPGDMFFGMDSFGASGRAQDLYEHFQLTPEPIVASIRDVIQRRSL